MALFRILAFVVFCCSISHSIAAGGNCLSQPVLLPITDVPLSNNSTKRGISLSVGTPPQELSFWPVVKIDNLWVYHSDDPACSARTEAACLTTRGGTFDDHESSTFQRRQDAEAAGSSTDDSVLMSKVEWSKDSLFISDNVSLPEFPVGITLEDKSTGNTLGLGANSTITTYLHKAGTIGSRVWSLWWGLAGGEKSAQMDGSIVFGGYDKAKIRGVKNHTGTFESLSDGTMGMTVTITELILNFPNGSNHNLLDPDLGSSIIPARICPEWPVVMSLPFDPYFSRFQEWTAGTRIGRSLGLNFFASQFNIDEVFQGDLTIRLDSGLSVRIPNSQLVLPDLTIDKFGQIKADIATQNVLIYSLEGVNRNDIACLGQYFLAAAYLMVDQDAEKFTIWEANPTKETDVVSVNDNESDKSCESTVIKPEPSSQGEKDRGGSGSPDEDEASSFALPAPLIAAIVVPVVVVAISAIVIVFCLRYRRRRQERESNLPLPPMSPMHQPGKEVCTAVEQVGNRPGPGIRRTATPLLQELWGGLWPKPGQSHVQELEGSNVGNELVDCEITSQQKHLSFTPSHR